MPKRANDRDPRREVLDRLAGRLAQHLPFDKRVRLLLRLPGWTRGRLAKRVGVHPGEIGRWLKGTEPAAVARRDHITRLLAEALDEHGSEIHPGLVPEFLFDVVASSKQLWLPGVDERRAKDTLRWRLTEQRMKRVPRKTELALQNSVIWFLPVTEGATGHVDVLAAAFSAGSSVVVFYDERLAVGELIDHVQRALRQWLDSPLRPGGSNGGPADDPVGDDSCQDPPERHAA
jgi:hypothetical protein